MYTGYGISTKSGALMSVKGCLLWDLPSKAEKAFYAQYKTKKEADDDFKHLKIVRFDVYVSNFQLETL